MPGRQPPFLPGVGSPLEEPFARTVRNPAEVAIEKPTTSPRKKNVAMDENETPKQARLPLVGVRVLECGDTLAAAYAGLLFARLGADVVTVEPPGGDPLRHAGPFASDDRNTESSASFGYFHAGKRSVELDPNDGAGRSLLQTLAAQADVVVRSTRAGDDWLNDDELDGIEALHPELIVADISTWGRFSGDRSMTDLIALAGGGLLSVNGTTAVAATSVPLRYRGEFASVHAACGAVMAVLGALHARLADGRGQRLDVSAQAATASVLATAVSTYLFTGALPARDGIRGVAPWGFYTCSDGIVLVQITEDPQWFNLRRIIHEPEWAQSEFFDTTINRAEAHDLIDELLNAALSEFTVDDFLAACQREGVAAAPVQTASDILGWEHLRVREFLQPIGFTGGPHTVVAPTAPWRIEPAAALAAPRRVPTLGTGEQEVLAEWTASRSEDSRALAASGTAETFAGSPPAAPLAGLRVIDMTWVWAGPYAAMQLAHLGADVVKLESTSRVDVTRRLGPFADNINGIDRSGYFNQYNQGKRSAVLNVKDPRGLAVLKQLVAQADLIIDNMRPGALARMGLPFTELQALNPKIVAVAMSGFGECGPERDRMAYGSIIDALSGVAASNGAPGGGPTDFPMSLPDPCAGIHAAIAATAALYRARTRGLGARVEVSMLEATMSAFPWPVLIESSGSGPVVADGNRDDSMSPHGVFRCAGDDAWLAIAVRNDREFAALATVLGRPEIVDDPRFVTFADRKAHEDELESVVSAWTGQFTNREAAQRLRHAGVLAEAVATMADVAASPVLAERGFFSRSHHCEIGDRPLPGPPWVASRSPMRARSAAPCFGQHTGQVLHDVLGLTDDEIRTMDDEGLLR